MNYLDTILGLGFGGSDSTPPSSGPPLADSALTADTDGSDSGFSDPEGSGSGLSCSMGVVAGDWGSLASGAVALAASSAASWSISENERGASWMW